MLSSSSSTHPRCASYPSWRSNGAAHRAPAAALFALLFACSREPIKVEDGKGSDFGLAELNQAVVVAGKDRDSPQAFRILAETVEKLRPQFNQPVSDLAERKLVFLAAYPIAAEQHRPPEERINALALTVWPTALKVLPAAEETSREYLQRICNAELAPICLNVVPEQWSVVIGREVISRLRRRARDSYAECDACQHDATYRQVVDLYDDEHARGDAEYAAVRDEVSPSAWPVAAPHAAPWPTNPPPLLVIRPGGEAWFRGVVAEKEDWAHAIAQERHDSDGLAVHIWPSDRVALLRTVLDVANRAGYRFLSLEVRERHYPYLPREYRLAMGGKGVRVQARDTDTIQVLVRFLDSAVSRTQPDMRSLLLLDPR
jgi:hypothetical protein